MSIMNALEMLATVSFWILWFIIRILFIIQTVSIHKYQAFFLSGFKRIDSCSLNVLNTAMKINL